MICDCSDSSSVRVSECQITNKKYISFQCRRETVAMRSIVKKGYVLFLLVMHHWMFDLVLDSVGTHAFNLIPVSFCCHRKLPSKFSLEAAMNEDDGKNEVLGSRTDKLKQRVVSNIEGAVRAVGLGDETYRFGDLTKKAVNVTEASVRTLIKSEDYKLGDITKNVTKVALGAAESQIRTVTGNDDYQFGDYTKRAIGDIAYTTETLLFENVPVLITMLYNYFEEIPSRNLFGRLKNDLMKEERSIMIQLLQLIAFIGFSFTMVMNISHSFSIIIAWTWVCVRCGISPTESDISWDLFLKTQTSLSVFYLTGPLLLPLQVAATFFFCPTYRDAVRYVEKRMPRTEKYPQLSRFFSLVTTFLIGNVLVTGLFTYFGCKGSSLIGKLIRSKFLGTGLPRYSA